MRTVEVMRQVFHLGEVIRPLPGGGPRLEVPDHKADHWIATGAARLVVDVPGPEPEVVVPAVPELPAPTKKRKL